MGWWSCLLALTPACLSSEMFGFPEPETSSKGLKCCVVLLLQFCDHSDLKISISVAPYLLQGRAPDHPPYPPTQQSKSGRNVVVIFVPVQKHQNDVIIIAGLTLMLVWISNGLFSCFDTFIVEGLTHK